MCLAAFYLLLMRLHYFATLRVSGFPNFILTLATTWAPGFRTSFHRECKKVGRFTDASPHTLIPLVG